ncbi:MAG: hypothetical protein KDK53_24185 [Maritimibacter sp.]|nr:hypothetical protein [Maritimibacter sp.]
MKKILKNFLFNETGAMSVDAIVVLGGATWMLMVVVSDIGLATVDLADRVGHELQYNSVINDILEGYGPNSPKQRGGESGA